MATTSASALARSLLTLSGSRYVLRSRAISLSITTSSAVVAALAPLTDLISRCPSVDLVCIGPAAADDEFAVKWHAEAVGLPCLLRAPDENLPDFVGDFLPAADLDFVMHP